MPLSWLVSPSLSSNSRAPVAISAVRVVTAARAMLRVTPVRSARVQAARITATAIAVRVRAMPAAMVVTLAAAEDSPAAPCKKLSMQARVAPRWAARVRITEARARTAVTVTTRTVMATAVTAWITRKNSSKKWCARIT